MPAWDGSSTLVSAITATQATGIAYTATQANSGLVPVGGIPYEFPILVGSEIMWVTQGSSGTASGVLTVIRGFAGTSAVSAVSGTVMTMLAGGPVDFLTRVSFTDTSSTTGDFCDTVSSSGADVARIAITGRDPTGVIHYGLNVALNGSTPVTGIGSQIFERYLVGEVAPYTTLTAAVTSVGQLTMSVASGTTQSQPFFAQLGKEVVSVTAGATGTTWTVLRGRFSSNATLHNSGDNVYVMPLGNVAIYQHTALVTGTAQGASGATGTTPPIVQLQSGQGATAVIGTVLRITGGPGASGIFYVTNNSSYGTDVVAINQNWSTLPTSATTYTLNNGIVLETLTTNGTGANANNQITNVQRAFWNDSADIPGGSNRTYYQKMFDVNNNATTTFQNVSVEILNETPSLPSGAALNLALCTGLADQGYSVNRQTTPATGSITAFTAQPTFIPVPGAGNLVAGASPNTSGAEGMWGQLTLVSGTAPYKGSADVRTQGTTT